MYKYPLLLTSFLSFLYVSIAYFFGTYIESYEIVYNSAVKGEFFDPITQDFFTSSPQLILLGLYAKLTALFPKISTFGLALSIVNFFTLLVLGLQLFAFISRKKVPAVLILGLVIVIYFDNVLHLSSTRIAFWGAVNFYLFSKMHSRIAWSIIPLLILAVVYALFRFEILILLSSLLLIFEALVKRRLVKVLFIPLLVSLGIMILFNSFLIDYGTEANRVFYYHENQMFMNPETQILSYFELRNLDLNSVNPEVLEQSLRFSSLFEFGMLDVSTMNWDYIHSLSGKKPSWFTYFFGAFNMQSFMMIMEEAAMSYLKIIYLPIVLICLTGLIVWKNKSLLTVAFHLFIIAFPIVLNFHIETPVRFLSPYYILVFIYFLVRYSHYFRLNKSIYYIAFLVLLLVAMYNTNLERLRFSAEQDRHDLFYGEIDDLLESEDLVIIEQDYNMTMLSRLPFPNEDHGNISFLNEFFVYKSYYTWWENHCECNPFSLQEKISFIQKNEVPLVLNPIRLEFLENYYNHYLNIPIKYDVLLNLSNDLILIKIRNE